MTSEESAILLKQKIDIYKEAHASGKKEMPCFFDGYKELVEDYEDIRSHSVKGVFPHKIFRERSPHQTDQEFNFVKNNYQQTANLPLFMDTVSSVSRAFNEVDSFVKYKETGTKVGDDYMEYVTSGVPLYHSVENYVVHVVPSNKLRDAMGVTVVKPKRPLTIAQTEQGEEIREDDQELRTPEIFYIPTPNIWSEPNKPYYILKTNEKSIVEENGKKSRTGLVCWVVDDENFHIYAQTGNKADYIFQLIDSFEHNSGEVPVKRFMGIPVINEYGELVYQSPFLYAVPALNVVVLDQSYLQISKDKTAFPVQVMIGNECDFIDPGTNSQCFGGVITYHNSEGHETQKQCTKCKGTGMKTRLSPQGTLLLRGRTRENPEGEKVSDALTYVSPETHTMEFLEKQIQSKLSEARNILHLKTDNKETGENVIESGANAKALTAFIKPISDQMYNLYEWILNIMGMQRYGEAYPKPDVIYPKSFEFLTEEDYLILIKQAQEAGAPPFVIHSLIWKYLSSIFYTDTQAAQISELIMVSDRLITLTTNEIQQGLLNKNIEPWEKILHDSAIKFVLELQKENNSFWADGTNRTQALIDKAKLRASEIKAATTIIPAIPPFNG